MSQRFAFAFALSAWLLSLGIASGQDKTEIKADGWGSLSGKVTFKGAAIPAPTNLVPIMKTHGDARCCLAGDKMEKISQTWLVDPKTKGVANVLIYLKAPAGAYFPIDDKDKVRKDEVVLDQPHCQFVPHMVAYYPYYFDGTSNVPTGEKFVIKNSATVSHNVRAIGNPLRNPGFNNTMPPGTSLTAKLNPQPLPVMVQCDIHNWMNAKVGVFDHPYFAITKADGSFTMPRVPAGAEVTVMAWHEGVGYVLGRDGETKTFEAGNNTFDFTVSK